MGTFYEIPTQPLPEQVTVAIAGVQYRLNLYWNVQNAAWALDISDDTGNPILTGIPLVTGVDLLEQFAYLGFGFQMIAQTDNDIATPPTFADLGSTGHLYVWVG